MILKGLIYVLTGNIFSRVGGRPMARTRIVKMTKKGLQVRVPTGPDGSFGTIYTPPYHTKTDAMRTLGQQWIIVED